MVINNYPYTDFHEMNLDWILSKIKELEKGTHGELDIDREYIIIADSYGTGDQWQTGQTTNPTWPEYVRQILGVEQGSWHVNASNGSGFTSGYQFIHQLMDVTALLPDPDAITDIILAGGYNDKSSSISAIKTAMQALDVYIKANYPNATVYLADIGWTLGMDERNAITAAVWPAYRSCSDYGWKYLQGTQYIMHDYELFCPDHFHPNQTGQETLGRYIAQAYLTGSCNPYYRFRVDVAADANTALFDAGTFNCISGFENGMIVQGMMNGSVTASTPFTMTNDAIILGTINSPYCHMGNYFSAFNNKLMSVWIRYDNGTKYANVYGTMVFESGADDVVNVKFYPFSHGETGSAVQDDTYANVDIINWRGWTMTTTADIG